MCYERWSYGRPPKQHARGYKTYHDFINWKRLEAPKPYFDEDGYYTAPFWWLCRRRVIPGLISMDRIQPIKIDPESTRALMDAQIQLLRNSARNLKSILLD